MVYAQDLKILMIGWRLIEDSRERGRSPLGSGWSYATPLARASDESLLAIAVLGATGRIGKQPPNAGVMRNIRVRPL